MITLWTMGHSRVFLLCLSALSGLCPSPAQSEGQKLNGIMGDEVAFNAPVLSDGILNYKEVGSIAFVTGGQSSPVNVDRFKGRVHWARETGHFHITQLNTEDSGQYRVQNTGGSVSDTTVFQLTVYNRVSKPQVSSKTQFSLLCPFLCSVTNGREVTLSWYREGEEKPLKHTSSPDLSTPLTLPLETEGLSHSYSCVATNPVSTQNNTVNPSDYCTAESPISQCAVAPAALALKIAVTAVFSVLTVLAVLTVIRITADLKRLREQLMNQAPQ
ncbi:SLAM family member 5-like [Amia ocellicauda]|uniref:SLAM family member 5-like n=1 Tax=Amia ocellicauda TaxID=2972642 RepID=UPI003463DDE9